VWFCARRIVNRGAVGVRATARPLCNSGRLSVRRNSAEPSRIALKIVPYSDSATSIYEETIGRLVEGNNIERSGGNFHAVCRSSLNRCGKYVRVSDYRVRFTGRLASLVGVSTLVNRKARWPWPPWAPSDEAHEYPFHNSWKLFGNAICETLF
jgi:hypothetical protein